MYTSGPPAAHLCTSVAEQALVPQAGGEVAPLALGNTLRRVVQHLHRHVRRPRGQVSADTIDGVVDGAAGDDGVDKLLAAAVGDVVVGEPVPLQVVDVVRGPEIDGHSGAGDLQRL